MSDGPIKSIIFDLGNVLVDFDHSIAAKKAALFCGKPEKEIFDFFFTCETTSLFEEGKILPSDFFLQMKKSLNLRLKYEEFILIWNEIFSFTDKNRAVYNLCKKLAGRYRIALLSNINTLHFDYLKTNFPVFDVFHHLFLSFELKLKKPDPLIYKKALEVLEVSPEQAFYTDDRAELIAAARSLGIKGFVFKDAEQLKEDLLGSGVNIN